MSLVNILKTFLITFPVQCTTTYPTLFIAFLTLPYKLLVFIIWKLFRPDLIAFVDGMSAWFSVDAIHTKPANNLTYFVILDGVIPLERFQQLFVHRVLNKTTSVNNENGHENYFKSDRNQKRASINSATDFQNRKRAIDKRGPVNHATNQRDPLKRATSDLESKSHSESENSGTLIYGKLRQYWTTFMGYNFWREDSNFEIKNHIKVYSSNEEVVNSEKSPKNIQTFDKTNLHTIKSNLLSQPFKECQSPWEILLLYNYYESCEAHNEKPESEWEGEKMVIILRIHHALADGYSLLTALQHDLPGRTSPLKIAQPNYSKKSLWNQIYNVNVCPYEVAKIYLKSIDRDNKWNLIFPFGEKPSGKFCTSMSNPMPVKTIKGIKDKFGVSYLAVMLTAVCEGVRRTMMDAGQTVPGYISFACPVPKRDHPDGFVNHMKTTTIVLPMGKMSCLDRLKLIEEQIRYEKTTMIRFVLTTYYEVWGFLPVPLLKINQKCHLIPSFIVSNFPVPEETTVIDGCEVSEFYVGYGSGFLNWGASIMMFGDGGKQSVVVTTDQVLYPSQEKFQKLGGYIEEEMANLSKCVPE